MATDFDPFLSSHPANTLYISDWITRGYLPYRDFWFNSLPGAIFCNFIALRIWGTLPGVLIGEFIAIFIAAACMYRTLTAIGAWKDWRRLAPLLLTITALSLCSIGGANGAGIWMLPFCAIFGSYIIRSTTDHRPSIAIIAGLLAATASLFLAREFLLIIIAALALRKRFPYFIAAFLSIIAAFTAWLLYTNGAEGFVNNVITYNTWVIRSGGWRFALNGEEKTVLEAFVIILPAITLVISAIRNKKKRNTTSPQIRTILTLWIFLEALALFLAGKSDASSFLPVLIPGLYLIALTLPPVADPSFQKQYSLLISLLITGTIITGFHNSPPLLRQTLALQQKSGVTTNEKRSALTAKILNNRFKETHSVFIWGLSSSTYFLSDRKAPTTINSIIPLFTKGYGASAIPDFIAQLEASPPDLIVLEAPVLPDTVREALPRDPHIEVSTDQSILFAYLQKILRHNYKFVLVQDGVLFCERLPGATPLHRFNTGRAIPQKTPPER